MRGLAKGPGFVRQTTRQDRILTSVREGSLPNGVSEEDSSGGSNRGRKGGEDPRAHSQTVAELPLAAHVGGNSGQEVKNNKLIRATVVQPLINGSSFPDGVKMHSNGVRTGDNGTRDDVIAVKQTASNRLTDSIDINYSTTFQRIKSVNSKCLSYDENTSRP